MAKGDKFGGVLGTQGMHSQYDNPGTQHYLDRLQQKSTGSDWDLYNYRRGLEWANQQRMTDPSSWQQAFSGAGGNGGGSGTLSNLVNIEQSPAYKWRYDQGLEAVNRTAAAKGMLGSGNRLAELTKYGQGMATQEYGDEWNRQYQLKALEQQRQLAQQQNAMQGMKTIFDINKRYMPPGTHYTAGGIVNRWD